MHQALARSCHLAPACVTLFLCMALSSLMTVGAAPIAIPDPEHGHDGTAHDALLTVILQSKVTDRFLRPAMSGLSFNAKGRSCNKRTAFAIRPYVRDRMLVHTFRNLKNNNLLSAGDASTLTALDYVEDSAGGPDQSSFFIIRTGPIGIHIESLKFPGQYIAVGASGGISLEHRPMVDYFDASSTFFTSDYFTCSDHAAYVRRQNAAITTAPPAPTDGMEMRAAEIPQDVQDILKQAFANTVQTDDALVLVHRTEAGPGPQTTVELPTASPEEPATTVAITPTAASTYIPRTTAPIPDEVLQILRDAGLHI